MGKFNQYFADTASHWTDQVKQIQKHLAKADIVPLDLRRLNALNRAKVLGYVYHCRRNNKIRFTLFREMK
ncbi:hypothetical protein [Kingella potus]|uniref:hypothetical protein n=1 Tax=Kingella potus TaxID=265175 RepID=UPI001FE82162|nr:hypothetical protein [Kingella potus]